MERSGRALAAIGHHEAAIAPLQQALQDWQRLDPPSSSYALCELLRVLGILNRAAEVQALRASVQQQIAPGTSSAFVGLAWGRALVQSGDAAGALETLEAEPLFEAAPSHVQTARLRWLASAQRALGKLEEAAACLRRLETLGESDQLYLARLDALLGGHDVGAIEHNARALLETEIGSVEARNTLVRLAPDLDPAWSVSNHETLRKLCHEYRYLRTERPRSMTPRPILVSFLGTSNYIPVVYELEKVRSNREPFIQVALCQVLPVKPERAFVMATGMARRRHGSELEKRLLGEGVSVEFVDISEGRTEQEVWAIFETLTGTIPTSEPIVFDATHGFRSLTLLGLLAMQYLRHARKANLAAVYYGAFESLGLPRDVQPMLSEGKDPGAAPIFDLTPLVELPVWTEAIASWKVTGRPDLLVDAMEPFTSAIKSEQKQRAPSFVKLPRALRAMGGALRLSRHDEVAPSASHVREMLKNASSELSSFHSLTPLKLALDNLDASLADLANTSAKFSTEASREYLDHQLALARWYINHGDLPQSLAILREALASCAVWCAVSFLEDGASFQERLPEQFREWLDSHPSLLDKFRSAEESCRHERNKLSHAWTGAEHSKEKMGEKSLEESRKKAAQGATHLEQLIIEISSLQAGDSPRPKTWAPYAMREDLLRVATQRPAARPANPRFLNLSNHPVATWPPEQLAAARALGLGEPCDLEGGMPQVDPEMDHAGVGSLADGLVKRALAQGAAGAHVSGEFSLAMALVKRLQDKNVRCFVATTRRESECTPREDGSVEKRSVFRFVRWRPYS